MSLFRKYIYDSANTTILRGILRLIAQNEEGFNYGDVNFEVDDDSLKVSNAERVNEDSEWPKKSSDGQVLFLDPEIYGGTTNNPAFYIVPPIKNGWHGLMDIVFPQSNPCDTNSDKNILGLKNIVDRATTSYEEIDDDPRLFLDPDCDNETPFAKIYSRENAASMEAMVYTTSRVYYIQYVLRALTAFSKVLPSFEDNLDDLFFQYVAESMKEQMVAESVSIGKRAFQFEDGVPVPRYWLLFLEQCVQLYARLRNQGKIEPTAAEAEAMDRCQSAQNAFQFPTSEDIQAEESALKGLLLSGGVAALAPYGIATGTAVFLLFRQLRLRKARQKIILQRKLETIQSVESSCIVILKYFLKQESSFVSDYLEKGLKNNPNFENNLIENIGEHFLNDADFMACCGNPTDVARYELGKLKNPLNNSDASVSSAGGISSNGMFVLEKYVKVKPKTGDVLPVYLQGVVNLEEFYDADFADYYASTDMISDHFGDLSLTTDEDGNETLTGTSNGISYGIRISYIVSDSVYQDRVSDFNDFATSQGLSLSDTIKMRGLRLDEAYSVAGIDVEASKYLIPLVSAEIDLPDMSISELSDISSGDFSSRTVEGNNYLSCLKRKMLESQEYELMFDQLLPIRRHFSLASVFVSQAFINAVGSSDDGYLIYNSFQVGDGFSVFRNTFEDWDKEILTKTKKRLKRLFMYQYNSSDELYEDADEQTDASERSREMFKNIKIDFNLNLKWWMRRRRVSDICPDDLGES